MYIDRYGYYYVSLTKKHKKHKVHRLVALMFIPNPENKPQVNHKWGVKTDNRASELEWNTPSENEIHKCRILGKSVKKVICVTTGEIYNSIKEASEKLNIDNSSITKCCKGKQKTSGRIYLEVFK